LKLFCIFFGLTLANEDRIHDYLTNSVGDILAHFVQYVFLLNTYLWQSHMTIAMSGDLAMENVTHFSSRAPFGPLNALVNHDFPMRMATFRGYILQTTPYTTHDEGTENTPCCA
jgi:hypothetical protein